MNAPRCRNRALRRLRQTRVACAPPGRLCGSSPDSNTFCWRIGRACCRSFLFHAHGQSRLPSENKIGWTYRSIGGAAMKGAKAAGELSRQICGKICMMIRPGGENRSCDVREGGAPSKTAFIAEREEIKPGAHVWNQQNDRDQHD